MGEQTTRILAIEDDAKGFDENKDKALKGGKTAGKLLGTYETETSVKVVSPKNYLKQLKAVNTDALPESDKKD